MAANGVRRTLQFSAKTLFNLASTGGKAKFSPFAFSTKSAFAYRFSMSRLPVELGGALSLMPLHSITASALFTSLLSLHNDSWGCLSEGFATPL